MKPVLQTKFGGADSPEHEKGNCFAACLASILEVPLETVPNFCAKEDTWYEDANAWLLENHGLRLMVFNYKASESEWLTGLYTVLSGPGPRGHRHCVVGIGGKMVHDPHPSGDGLLETDSADILLVAAE